MSEGWRHRIRCHRHAVGRRRGLTRGHGAGRRGGRGADACGAGAARERHGLRPVPGRHGPQARIRRLGIPVSGSLDDLLEQVDVVLDATPGGIGAKNKQLYQKHGVKAIFQGGEKNEMADVFFHGYANYEKGLGQSFLKLTSCNTTGLIRAVDAMDRLRSAWKRWPSPSSAAWPTPATSIAAWWTCSSRQGAQPPGGGPDDHHAPRAGYRLPGSHAR
jgi:hypothetical protein